MLSEVSLQSKMLQDVVRRVRVEFGGYSFQAGPVHFEVPNQLFYAVTKNDVEFFELAGEARRVRLLETE